MRSVSFGALAVLVLGGCSDAEPVASTTDATSETGSAASVLTPPPGEAGEIARVVRTAETIPLDVAFRLPRKSTYYVRVACSAPAPATGGYRIRSATTGKVKERSDIACDGTETRVEVPVDSGKATLRLLGDMGRISVAYVVLSSRR